jgi:hypothetical protein
MQNRPTKPNSRCEVHGTDLDTEGRCPACDLRFSPPSSRTKKKRLSTVVDAKLAQEPNPDPDPERRH